MIFSALSFKVKILTAAGAAFLLAACASGRVRTASPQAAPAFASAPGPDWARADSLWAQRGTPEAAWAALLAYRNASDEQPEAPALWTRYARAAAFVAAYTEANETWSNPERRHALYREGARAAEKALRLHPEYSRALAESGEESVAVRQLRGEWLQPAFWLLANRGRQALSEGGRTRLAGRERLETLARALMARDETLNQGGLHRFLGVMHVVGPQARDLDSARAHFTRAQSLSPLYFANHRARAEYLATAQRDSASFRELLEWVIAAPADTLPEAAIENAFEQARARDLLSRQADLFSR